jgi:hypothetical protein
MARKGRPWWWKQIGEWCVTIDGKRHRLGTDDKNAQNRFHALMAAPERNALEDSVFNIFKLFLKWTKAHRATETHVW